LKTPASLVVAAGWLALLVAPAAGASVTVVVNCDGTAFGALPPIGPHDDVVIQLREKPEKPDDKCTCENWKIQYRAKAGMDDLPPPTVADFIGSIRLQRPKGTRFISYALLEPGNVVSAERERDELTEKRSELPRSACSTLIGQVNDDSAALKEVNDALDAVSDDLARIAQRIQAFVGSSAAGAIDEIRRLQDEDAALRSRLKTLQQCKDQLDAIATLDSKIEALSPRTKFHWIARKLGWLVTGREDRTVTYGLIPSDGAQPFHLERRGEYPVITDRDYLYALLLDVKMHSFHFDLAFNATHGAAEPNPAPIRPTFEALVADAASMLVRTPLGPIPGGGTVIFDEAYADVLLPFGEKFHGGDILKVTISSEMAVVAEDSTSTETEGGQSKVTQKREVKRQIVKLIDDIEYPQVHTTYAYNLATGLVVSGIRRPTFVKVQTVVAEKPVDDRYRTDTLPGSLTVKPVATLSFYLFRKLDIQVPVTWKERVVPAPTVGFSLSSPTDDIFVGLSHELLRNTQLIYGFHWARVDELGPQSPVEEQLPTVTTDKHFKHKAYVGITLNLNFIRGLFAK
jgi:hypothetical protein